MRIRTGYSFRSAVGRLPDVFSRLEEVEYPFFPITDRASTFGWVRWSKLCKEKGVKPIFGIELGVSPEPTAKKPIIDHWTFIADSSIVPLNKLLEIATAQFRYEPLLTIEQAIGAHCIKIVGNKTDISLIDPNVPDLFVGLSPSLMTGQIKRVKERGLKLIACSDNVYPRNGDSPFYEVVCGRNASTQSYSQFILSKQEWGEGLSRGVQESDKSQAWATFLEIGNRVSARLKMGTLLVPEKPLTLNQMCIDNAPSLNIDLSDPVYGERLKKELGLISEKQYEDYFYIIADIVSWARERMIVGPARGSSCGSLVCYLLGITTIDPIPYGLIFERFIDINRDDLPDIDIDFSDQKRHLVFERMEEKYGRDKIARLGTVSMYRPASALKETASALRVPGWKASKALDSLIERSGGDSRALSTLEDTLLTTPNGKGLLAEHPEMMLACSMEGHPRHQSQHAAGIILTDEPVREYIAVDTRSGATHCDKKDAEDLDLLKIDALGLTQLSVFEDALEMVGLPHDHLEKVDLKDPKAFEIINKGYFSGIFQFNGPSLQALTYQVNVTELDDIVAITALARPGPMSSGGAHEWVMRHNGVHKTTVPHPLFAPYLEETRGIVIYQEQVMEIGRKIGDLTWNDVTALRKAMSKSLGKEYFDQFGDRWKSAAAKKGIPDETLEKVWDDLCLSGDTVIENPYPSKGVHKFLTVKQLYDRGGLGPTDKNSGKGKRQSILMHQDGRLKPSENWGVIYSGKKQTYTLKTKSGNEIHTTKEHKFLTPDGSYKRLENLSVGNFVCSDSGPIPSKRKEPKKTGSGGHNWWHKIKSGEPSYSKGVKWLRANFKNCQVCEKAPYEETHHINMDHEDHSIENLHPVCRKCHKKLHAAHSGYPKAWQSGRGIFNDEILSIKPRKIEPVYDISMPDPYNNFLANGIVVHNCLYGAWAFNKSHSVAYGIISYWCCWLKAHFPLEFAAATLNHEKDPGRQLNILRELASEGISYLPVDPEASTDVWVIREQDGVRSLAGPVQNVKGIGPKLAQQIVSARNKGEEIPERAQKLLTNPVTPIDSLWPIKERIKQIMPDPSERNIHTEPTPIGDIELHGDWHDYLFFAVADQISPKDEIDTVSIAKHGGVRIDGEKNASLNLVLKDDTGMTYSKVTRFKYPHIGKQIVDRGRPGKSIYAIKGSLIPKSSFMIIKMVRYIGDMDDDHEN